MVCDCKNMRACSERIVSDGPSESFFWEWHRHAYWFHSDITADSVYGECVHIRALRQYLKWTTPLLETSIALQWEAPSATVVLHCNVPVLSVLSQSASHFQSRVYVKRWGKRYLCQMCSGGNCSHVKRVWDEVNTEEEDEENVGFLPPDESHELDMQLRRQIESGSLLLEKDKTLKRCTQVTIPFQPPVDLLFNLILQPFAPPNDLFAEDAVALDTIGGSCFQRCNMCGSEWSNSFAEPTPKKLFTRYYSTIVNGMYLSMV